MLQIVLAKLLRIDLKGIRAEAERPDQLTSSIQAREDAGLGCSDSRRDSDMGSDSEYFLKDLTGVTDVL